MKLRNTLMIISTVLILVSLPAESRSLNTSRALPKYYPTSFVHTGTVRDLSRGQLMINGILYKASMNVKVHTLQVQFASLRAVNKDDDIGFSLNTLGYINEIWVLPSGTVPQY